MLIARVEKLIRHSLSVPAASDFTYRSKVYIAARRAWRDNARRRNIPEDRIDAFLREIEHCIENIELEHQLGSPPSPAIPLGPALAKPARSKPDGQQQDKRPTEQRPRLGPFADPQEWPDEPVRVPPPKRSFLKLRIYEKLALAAVVLLILIGVAAYLSG